MSFRGEEFIAIDEDAIQDGDAVTMPLDTYAQNRLQSNLMFLAQEPRDVAYTPTIDNADDDATFTGIRTVGVMTAWVSLIEGTHPATKKTNTYEIAFHANVQAQGAASSTGDIILKALVDGNRATISVNGGTSSVRGTIPNSDGAWMPIVLTVTAPDFTEFTDVRIEVFVQSEDSSARAGSMNAEALGWVVSSEPLATSTFLDDSTTALPNASDLSVQYLQIADGGSADPIDSIDNLDMMGEAILHSTIDTAQQVTPNTGSLAIPAIGRRYMSYIQIRSLCIRPVPPVDSITHQAQSTLEALKVPASVTALRHLEGIRDLYTRPRLLWMGPSGVMDVDLEGYEARGIPFRWPFVKGNLAATPGVDLFNASIKPMTTDGRITVWMRVLCVQEYLGFTEDDDTGSAEWSLSFDIEQPDTVAAGSFDWATDATSLGSTSITPRIQISRSGLLSSRLLRTVGIMERLDRTALHSFAHYEGSIFEGEVRQHTQEILVSIPVSGYDATRNPYPVRLRGYVDTALTHEDVEYIPGTAGSWAIESVRLYCLSCRIYEQGVLNG